MGGGGKHLIDIWGKFCVILIFSKHIASIFNIGNVVVIFCPLCLKCSFIHFSIPTAKLHVYLTDRHCISAFLCNLGDIDTIVDISNLADILQITYWFLSELRIYNVHRIDIYL